LFSCTFPTRRSSDLGDFHFAVIGALDDFFRVAVQVEDQRSVGVPGGYDRGAPPVTALVVVYIPGDDRVVWVTGPVVLGVDFYAVAVCVTPVEVARTRYTLAVGATFDTSVPE